MEPIAIAVNDLGEPDAGNPPVRFDEGRRLCAFYSTTLFLILVWELKLPEDTRRQLQRFGGYPMAKELTYFSVRELTGFSRESAVSLLRSNVRLLR